MQAPVVSVPGVAPPLPDVTKKDQDTPKPPMGVTLRRLYSLAWPERGPLALATVFLLFSSLGNLAFPQAAGVFPVHETDFPERWNGYARRLVGDLELAGDLVILTEGPSPEHPAANHRMEIIDLACPET